MFKVKRRYLLLIAALVWCLAGFNVLKIGIEAYGSYVSLINVSISLIIFCLFWFFVFSRLVKKHTDRIIAYEEERVLFIKFFDVKSFMIMAFMITFGVLIRAKEWWPMSWIAVFYAGLGSTLFLAGCNFIYNFFRKKACF